MSYQENGIGWQLHQLQRRIGEWYEYHTQSQSDNDGMDWTNSVWWEAFSQVVFWMVLAGVVFWLGWMLWQLLSPYLYQLFQPSLQTPVSHSPDSPVTLSQWLSRSQQSQRRGNYTQACFCLYMAMLQRLHDQGIAQQQASRTDGEYLRIIQELPKPEAYQFLITTHQSLRFGRVTATRSLFEDCQRAFSQL
ncbi:DUF4129 domain-containing protein [Spirulina sp. CS-785/01]|uniref:DUF4129 domain-containing protein n=1 Tax=Spirulina sp. CS-785/01 TaxID=3021716 RepID=UPI00232A87AE|nr:DUF4129 domain-containing protein [Spirulina sp. CS-785/01]MDB9314269.1 DUF4129 domain-containing protein [Spirulina sp. CS-785/01]